MIKRTIKRIFLAFVFLLLLIQLVWADQPRFRYLVFLKSNGYILLDIDMPHRNVPPFIKDQTLAMWNNKNETWTRNDLTIVGPLVNFTGEKTTRNAQRLTGHTKKIGNELMPLTSADYKAFFIILHPEKYKDAQ